MRLITFVRVKDGETPDCRHRLIGLSILLQQIISRSAVPVLLHGISGRPRQTHTSEAQTVTGNVWSSQTSADPLLPSLNCGNKII